jgi:two-component system LytT family response regulator
MNKTISAIVIDDEPLALRRLLRLLEKYEEIEIVGEAANGEQALQLIEEHKPDLIFLDVEMPVMNGFEMLAKLKHHPRIIFTTAFEEYAIKAFEENSVDYLLKPIEVERLDKSIEKLRRFNGTVEGIDAAHIQSILNAVQVKKEIKSIPVKIGDKILLIKTSDIIYFEAKEKFVYIMTEEGREYLTDYTVAALEEKLSAPFLRVHRAFIINTDKIKEFYKGFNSTFIVVMKDSKSTRINTGRSFNESIRHLFEI